MSRITPILLVVGCAPLFVSGSAWAGPELSKNDVKRIIVDALPEMRRCSPDMNGGKLIAHWTIEPEGNVTGVKLDGDHADDAIGKCVRKKISELRFGHSIKRTPVTAPIQLGDVVTRQDKDAAKASSGKLTKKDLDGLLDILAGEIKECGDDGAVRAKFTIRPTGRVKDLKVKDADKKTEACVKSKISRVRFPAPDKATNVNRKFDLGTPAKNDEG
jgi:hypothetical protein